MIAPPRIVVAGIARAGVGLLSAMLTCGGATDFLTALDPHRFDFGTPDKKTVGLWIERDDASLARSVARVTPAAPDDDRPQKARHLALCLQAATDFFAARDAAARCFAPLFVFRYEDIIADPMRQAQRLGNLLSVPGTAHARLPVPCPHFDARSASLAVRRIARPARPNLIVVRSMPSGPRPAA